MAQCTVIYVCIMFEVQFSLNCLMGLGGERCGR